MASLTFNLLPVSADDDLEALATRLGNPRPMNQEMAEYVLVSTKERFPAGVDPDGVKWAPNKPSTLARKKGNRPLIGESKRLGTEILQNSSEAGFEVGSNLIYARVMQEGAAQGEFGTTAGGSPIPWGDIVPRQFLGLSERDEQTLFEIAQEYLQGTSG
jgi:phage virion morphogenesis protein